MIGWNWICEIIKSIIIILIVFLFCRIFYLFFFCLWLHNLFFCCSGIFTNLLMNYFWLWFCIDNFFLYMLLFDWSLGEFFKIVLYNVFFLWLFNKFLLWFLNNLFNFLWRMSLNYLINFNIFSYFIIFRLFLILMRNCMFILLFNDRHSIIGLALWLSFTVLKSRFYKIIKFNFFLLANFLWFNYIWNWFFTLKHFFFLFNMDRWLFLFFRI